MPIRSFSEVDIVMKRVADLVHKYLPDYSIQLYAPRNGRMPDWYGINNLRKKVIQVSKDLIEQAPWEEIEDVVVHEIAHTYQHPKSTDHGREWYDIAKALGSIEPSRSAYRGYTYGYRFLYKCSTCGLRFESPYQTIRAGTRGENEPGSHPFGHREFYVMDTVNRERWKVER